VLIGIVSAATWTLSVLPIPIAYFIGDLLAVPWALMWLVRDRACQDSRSYWRNRAIVCRPGSPLPELPRFHLWRWSRYMAWLLIDFCRIRAITKDNVHRFVDVESFEPAAKILAEQKGAIAATAHFGTWDLGGHVSALLGFPLVSVYQPSVIPAFERALVRLRGMDGRMIVAKTGMLRTAKRALQERQAVAILCDGAAKEGRVFPPFLGVAASTITTPALLHLMTGAPIVVATFERTGRSRFALTIRDVIRHEKSGDRDADVLAITTRINAALTQAIVEHPEQWFWQSRRFRHRPPGETFGPDGLPPLCTDAGRSA